MKKTPKRKCLVTNEIFDKKDLIRIVRTPDKEVIVDVSGKTNGRGAYLKLSNENIKKAKERNVLSRALQVDIPESVYLELEAILND